MENQKTTCAICNESFDTIQQQALHHARKHPNEPLDYEESNLSLQNNKDQEESI